MLRPPPRSTLFPYTTLFRSLCKGADGPECLTAAQVEAAKKIYAGPKNPRTGEQIFPGLEPGSEKDRKSTRLNSSHEWISYAVFCLKKKKEQTTKPTRPTKNK